MKGNVVGDVNLQFLTYAAYASCTRQSTELISIHRA